MCQGIQEQLKQLALIQQSVLTSDQGKEGKELIMFILPFGGQGYPPHSMLCMVHTPLLGAGGMGKAYRQMNLTRIDSTAETLRLGSVAYYTR